MYFGVKLAQKSSPKAGLCDIVRRLQTPNLRETLLYGFGLTNGIMGTPHLLAEAHKKAYGCDVQKTFADHWAYSLGKEINDIPERNAEVLVQTAYDIFAAAEKAIWSRGSLGSRPVEPVTEFVADLKFGEKEFIVMVGNMWWPPCGSVAAESKTVFDFVKAVFPHYKKRLPSE